MSPLAKSIVGTAEEGSEEEDPDKIFKEIVQGLFAKYKPGKAHAADKMLQKFKGNENKLVAKLRDKFEIDATELPDYPQKI